MEGGNEGANTLFGTVDTLFDTVDREGVGNEEGANLLLLPPLWSVLGRVIHCLPYSLISLWICWQSLCLEPKSMVK